MNLEHRLLSWYYSIPPSKRLIVDQFILNTVGIGIGIIIAVSGIMCANKIMQ
jgi:glycopeptide antibiotics resistance protein